MFSNQCCNKVLVAQEADGEERDSTMDEEEQKAQEDEGEGEEKGDVGDIRRRN